MECGLAGCFNDGGFCVLLRGTHFFLNNKHVTKFLMGGESFDQLVAWVPSLLVFGRTEDFPTNHHEMVELVVVKLDVQQKVEAMKSKVMTYEFNRFISSIKWIGFLVVSTI